MHGIPTTGCNPFSVFFWLFFGFGCLFWFVCSFLVCFVYDGIAHWTLYWSTTSSFEAADQFDALASKLQFSFSAAVECVERRQMLNKCQLILATGGTVAQDLTMQWSTMGGFMQELSLMVIDEGQQYGTDREIAVISLLRQQPLVLWTGGLGANTRRH